MAPLLLRPWLRQFVLGLGLALLCAAAGERVPGMPGAEQGLGGGRGCRGTLGSGSGIRLWGLGDGAEQGTRDPGQVSRHRVHWSREVPLALSFIFSPGFSFPPVQFGGLLSLKSGLGSGESFESGMSRPVRGHNPSLVNTGFAQPQRP